MQGLSLPFLVYQLTGSKSLLGIVAAASLLPAFVVTLPSGVIADRFSKRRIVLITQTALLMQALALATLTFTHLIRPWHIVALGTFAGFANSMDMPTRQAMVVELVGKDDLANAVALNSSMFNLTRIAGPFVGGIVYAAVGPAWCFLINAVSYLGAIVGLLLMRNVKAAMQVRRDQPMRKQIGEGLWYVWRDKLMRNMLVMTGVSQMFLMPYGIFFAVFATTIYKVGPTGQGMMSAAVGVGALAAALGVSSLGHLYENKTIAFAGAILAPLGLLGFALCRSFHGTLAYLVVIGMGMMMFMAASNTILQVGAPAGLGGRVMSLRALVMFGLGALGSAMMGRLAEVRHVDVRGTILIGASVGLASSLYFAFSSLRSREPAALTAALASEEVGVDAD